MKPENLKQAIRAASRHGLWVMSTGKGEGLRYEFFDRKSGKMVLAYYPTSKHWLGVRDTEGRADNCEDAIRAAMAVAG